jgi:hypothetical protein
MKFIVLTGGFAGFLLAGGGSYWAGHQPDRILFDGAAGCLAGGLLFRWFWTILVGGIRETILQRPVPAPAGAASAPTSPAPSAKAP